MSSKKKPKEDSLPSRGPGLPMVIDGRRIKRLRRELGLTQARLARLLNSHPLTILRWERGRGEPRGPALLLLAFLFVARDADPFKLRTTCGVMRGSIEAWSAILGIISSTVDLERLIRTLDRERAKSSEKSPPTCGVQLNLEALLLGSNEAPDENAAPKAPESTVPT